MTELPSKEDFKNTAGSSFDAERAFKQIDKLMWAVIVVLAVGFITLLIAVISPIVDAWRFRASSYQELVTQINIQSAKIDLLSRQCIK